MQIKQWIKENQDLIALGAFVTVCARPFRAGQIDKVNGRMFCGEYSYDGLPPQDVIDSAMAQVSGPNDVISLEAPPAVEA